MDVYIYYHFILIVVFIISPKFLLMALFIIVTCILVVCVCVPGPVGEAVVYHVKVMLLLDGRGVT